MLMDSMGWRVWGIGTRITGVAVWCSYRAEGSKDLAFGASGWSSRFWGLPNARGPFWGGPMVRIDWNFWGW